MPSTRICGNREAPPACLLLRLDRMITWLPTSSPGTSVAPTAPSPSMSACPPIPAAPDESSPAAQAATTTWSSLEARRKTSRCASGHVCAGTSRAPTAGNRPLRESPPKASSAARRPPPVAIAASPSSSSVEKKANSSSEPTEESSKEPSSRTRLRVGVPAAPHPSRSPALDAGPRPQAPRAPSMFHNATTRTDVTIATKLSPTLIFPPTPRAPA